MIRSVLKYNTTQASRRGNPLRFQDISKNFKPLRVVVPLLVVGLCVLVYWLFLTPAFAIEKIEMRGSFIWPQERLSSLVSSQLAQKRWFFAHQNNIFTFDKLAFANTISQQFIIDKISVERQRPHTLIINTLEKPRKALWSSQGVIYALDAEGIVTGVADLNTPDNQFIIYDKNEENAEVSEQNRGVLNAGTPVLSAGAMAFLNNLITNDFIRSLNPRFAIVSGLNPDYASVKFSEAGQPTAGWNVYFSIDDTLETQVENLKLVLQHSIPPAKRSALNYIDLRFDNKVYYK